MLENPAIYPGQQQEVFINAIKRFIKLNSKTIFRIRSIRKPNGVVDLFNNLFVNSVEISIAD